MNSIVILAAVQFVTLDPGHFHASLVQNRSYPEALPEVKVFAPDGPELASHLKLIDSFNTREVNPTAWKEDVYRGADYLILDEPTAVLTPQETQKLFGVMWNMKQDGKSIVIITHKLHEVMAISDRVAVLRKGEYVGSVATKDTDPQQLTDMMVGRAVSLNIDRPEPVNIRKCLEVKNLSVVDIEGVTKLDDVSFTAYGGEILGIAGVSGSGQKELLEVVAGLQPARPGSSVIFTDMDGKTSSLIGKTPMEIKKLGVHLAFVPEDRLGMGLVGNLDIADNMLIRTYTEGSGMFVDMK